MKKAIFHNDDKQFSIYLIFICIKSHADKALHAYDDESSSSSIKRARVDETSDSDSGDIEHLNFVYLDELRFFEVYGFEKIISNLS